MKCPKWFFLIFTIVTLFPSESFADKPIFETRALWVGEHEMKSRDGIDEVIEKSLRANLNLLFPLVYCGGNTFFNNTLMEMNPGVEQGLDPLKYMVERAHEKGLEVHPWFCVMKGDSELFKKYPKFEAMAPEREPLNPTRLGTYGISNVHYPGFRDFIVNLMLQCVENYDVDGIHFDYIRAGMTSFDDESQRIFNEKFNADLYEATKDQLNDWHGPAVEDIIVRTVIKARELKPDIIISAAVFTKSWMYDQNAQGQDAVKWAKNGWLDIFFNMNYHNQTSMIDMAEHEISSQKPTEGSRGTGLALFMTDDQGRENIKRPPALVVEQIKTLKKFKVRNISLFVSGLLTEDVIQELVSGPFETKALPHFRKPD